MAARQRLSRARRALQAAEAAGDQAGVDAALKKLQEAEEAVRLSAPSCSTGSESGAGGDRTTGDVTSERDHGTTLTREGDVTAGSVEERVRQAYTALARRPGDSWISLAALRQQLADVPRHELDEALMELALQPGVHIQAEANQQGLTAADHEAAVRFGGSSRHMLLIEKKGRRR